jgi:hypothetical protein
MRLTPCTRVRQEAERWLMRNHGALDGIVAKRLDHPYSPGERAMLKVKQSRSADCAVGFRYGQGSRLVGSLLLGLFNAAGKLDRVGFTSGRHIECRSFGADGAPGSLARRTWLYRRCIGWSKPLEHRTVRLPGCLFVPSWWWRSATTT